MHDPPTAKVAISRSCSGIPVRLESIIMPSLSQEAAALNTPMATPVAALDR